MAFFSVNDVVALIIYALEYVDTYNYHFNPRQYYDHDGEEFINDIGNPCHYHYHQEQLGRYKLYEVYNRKDHEYIADCCIIISPILLDDPSPTLICDQSKTYVPCNIPAEFNGGQEVGDCCE